MSSRATFQLLNDKKRIPERRPGPVSSKHPGTPALSPLFRPNIHGSMVDPAEKVNSIKMMSIFKIGDWIDWRLTNDDQIHVYSIHALYTMFIMHIIQWLQWRLY